MYGQGIELYCAPTVDDRETWLPTMRHIALEGRCFVLSACQFARRVATTRRTIRSRPTARRGADRRRERASSIRWAQVLAGPARDGEAILTADLDLDEIARGKFDLDVVGHYARPDIFRLTVDRRPKGAVTWSDVGEE